MLCIPSSRYGYVGRLNSALRAHGVDLDETSYPYLRWPRAFLRFAIAFIKDNDLCHIHWNIFDSLTVARFFFSTSIPKVWTVHNLIPHEPVFRDDLAVTHMYLDWCKAAVWHSQRTIEDAKRAFAARGLPATWRAKDFVIPCMNFNGAWPDTISESEARAKLGFKEGEFVVGHFSPSHPYKGTEKFLKVASMLQRDDITFSIFGNCQHPALKRKILEAASRQTNIRLHIQFISDEEMQYWFKSCDVVVEPYEEVTTSGAMFFPIAFKRPVIAPPMGNIPDVIQHKVTGWLASTPEDIRGCIIEAKSDLEETKRIGSRAYDFVERTAGIDKIASSYIAVYENVTRK